jgi:hypothetical protein
MGGAVQFISSQVEKYAEEPKLPKLEAAVAPFSRPGSLQYQRIERCSGSRGEQWHALLFAGLLSEQPNHGWEIPAHPGEAAQGQGHAYRRGYYADELATTLAAGQKPDTDPLLMLMGRNLPDYSQILYKIKVLPADPQPAPDAARIGSNTDMKGPFTRYGVDFAIAPQDLKPDPSSDGGRLGGIEIVLLAYDREAKPLNFVVTKGDVNLDPKLWASVQQVGIQIHKEIDVPKEYVYLRTGIYDLRSNTAGTLGIPLADAKTDVSAPAAK